MKSEFIIAVHALVYMAHVKRSTASEELAENICTNPVRVRNVMSKLKKAGIVITREGKNGGYLLARKAEDIPLSSLVEPLDTSFLSTTWRSGSLDLPCMISNGMKQVMDDCFDDMEALCLNYLKSRSIHDIEVKLIDIQQNKL